MLLVNAQKSYNLLEFQGSFNEPLRNRVYSCRISSVHVLQLLHTNRLRRLNGMLNSSRYGGLS